MFIAYKNSYFLRQVCAISRLENTVNISVLENFKTSEALFNFKQFILFTTSCFQKLNTAYASDVILNDFLKFSKT